MPLKPKDAPELANFTWDDPFLLDDQLTEDERMMRDAARAYAQEKLQPRVIEAFAKEQTDPKKNAKWVKWACWALPFQKNTADLARHMSHTVLLPAKLSAWTVVTGQ